jgi:spermidine dehydrogenase
MHAIRDGSFWASKPTITDSGQDYDLVVVGGGISGLAAAFLFLQQRPDAKVLVIDPLNDFGGHAKRNAFTASNGKLLIGYGGSQSMQTPSYFSPAVNQLLSDVGIVPARFEEFYDQAWSEDRGLSGAVFFDKAQWGVDKLVIRTADTAEWVSQTPMNEQAKADIIALIDAPGDYLPGMTPEERLDKLSQITYKEFLLDYVKADPQVVDYFQNSTAGYFGVGIDAATIVGAELNRSDAQVTVRFVSQIISSTIDSAGKIIEGDAEQVVEVTDVWTFARDTRSRDLNWKLVATESGS